VDVSVPVLVTFCKFFLFVEDMASQMPSVCFCVILSWCMKW